MKNKTKKYLFLGAHLDDIELGCGGLIAKLQKDKYNTIKLLTLSHFNKNSKGEITIDRDINETYKAIEKLGLKKDQISIEEVPAQLFEEHSQEIREILLKYRKEYNPDIIFFPSKNDIHQDHQVVCREGERIFRDKSCLGYELIRSTYHLIPNCYIALNKDEIERKIAAAKCYKTQLTQSAGYYFDKDTIISNAIFRGKQFNKEYAEAFEIYYCSID